MNIRKIRNGKESKSSIISKLIMQGLNSDEIRKATGFRTDIISLYFKNTGVLDSSIIPKKRKLTDADRLVCRECGSNLDSKNWYPSSIKKKDYICSSCRSIKNAKRLLDPILKEKDLKYRRKYQKEYEKTSGRKEYLRVWKDKNRELVRAWEIKGALKRKFGITVERYYTMLKEQNGKCAICGSDKPKGKGRWHVDHCHKTGEIRGLLCCHCNQALGLFRDNIDTLNSAREYLSKFIV